MENKVYSDQFGTHDMSGWLGEKTEYVIKALLRLHKEIDNINNGPEMPYGYEEPQESKEEKVKIAQLFELQTVYKSHTLEENKEYFYEKRQRYNDLKVNGNDAGWILKKVIINDRRNFEVREREMTNKYKWIK